MSESDIWNKLKSVTQGKPIHMQRHEDKHAGGVPDVSYGHRKGQGWIELKSLPHIPFDWNQKIDLDLRSDQANWLYNRGRLTHSCFLLVEFEAEELYYVFSWKDVLKITGWNYYEYHSQALKVMDNNSFTWFNFHKTFIEQ